MKNIFKKTAGIMIATSMLCAIMATGCTASEESTNSKENTATGNAELTQQTLVDELTRIQVSGMMPVDSKIEADMEIIDGSIFYDRWDPPYTVESDFPELTGAMDNSAEGESDRKIDNIAKIINEKGWAQTEVYAGGNLAVRIDVANSSENVDFESDLIVTLPFNYRRGLINGGIEGEIKAVQYDYDSKEFVELEIVPAEDTPKGRFQFKAKSDGCFFIASEGAINSLKHFYDVNEE